MPERGKLRKLFDSTKLMCDAFLQSFLILVSSPLVSSPYPPHILRKRLFSETVFINVFGAQELTRDEFRQPMYPELVFLKSLWGLGTEAEFIPWNRFLCFINVLKYGFLLYIGWRNSFLRRRIDSLAPQTF